MPIASGTSLSDIYANHYIRLSRDNFEIISHIYILFFINEKYTLSINLIDDTEYQWW